MAVRLRKLGKVLPSPFRRALKRVLYGRTSGGTPRVNPGDSLQSDFSATEAFVLDSGTLHLRLVSNLEATQTGPARLHLVSGQEVDIERSIELQDGIANVHFRLPDSARLPGVLIPLIDCGYGPKEIRYRLSRPASSSVIRHPFSSLDGVRIRPVAVEQRALSFKVERLQTVHVANVEAVPGFIEVSVNAVLSRDEEPQVIRVQRRGTDTVHDVACTGMKGAELTGSREARWDFAWRVPTVELSRSTSGEPSGIATWDTYLITGRRSLPLEHRLGDIKDPRSVLRYRTIRDVDAEERDAFRPYWTKHGTLALEHFHGAQA